MKESVSSLKVVEKHLLSHLTGFSCLHDHVLYMWDTPYVNVKYGLILT